MLNRFKELCPAYACIDAQYQPVIGIGRAGSGLVQIRNETNC